MSTLSKVFIVFNLLLAFCFTMASLTLYAKKVQFVDELVTSVNERNDLAKKLAAEQKQLVTLKTDTTRTIKDQEETITGLTATNTGLVEMNGELKTRSDKLDVSVKEIESSIGALEAQIKKKDDLNADLQKERNTAVELANKAVKARLYAEQSAVETIAELNQAQRSQRLLAEENSKLVTQNMTLVAVIGKTKAGEQLGLGLPPLPIAGLVEAVDNDAQILIMNVGEKNSVQPGMQFIISRGSQYIGTVQIRNVHDQKSSAVFLRDMMKSLPKVSDRVQYRVN